MNNQIEKLHDLLKEGKMQFNAESNVHNSQQSQRFNAGKPQTNEIDPDFILGMGRVLTKSREKYDRANWTKSTPWMIPYDSAMRHLLAFQKGEDNDAETKECHLLHTAVNLMFLHYYYNTQPQNDDRIFKPNQHVNLGCDLPNNEE